MGVTSRLLEDRELQHSVSRDHDDGRTSSGIWDS